MPAPVDAGYAQWLRDPALYSSWANGGLPAGLLASAIESEIVSPFSTKAAADAEGARQGAFLGSPLALDRHIVKGQRVSLVGRAVTLKNDALGYSAGVLCFVLEAQELENDLTALLVLRKLA